MGPHPNSRQGNSCLFPLSNILGGLEELGYPSLVFWGAGKHLPAVLGGLSASPPFWGSTAKWVQSSPSPRRGGGGLGGNWGASFRGLQGKWGAHLVFWRGWKMSFHCFRGAVGKLGCPPFNFGIHQNGFGVTKAQGQWQKLGCSFWGEAVEKLGYPFCILRCWGVPPFF